MKKILAPLIAVLILAGCYSPIITMTSGTGYSYAQVHATNGAYDGSTTEFRAVGTCSNGGQYFGNWVNVENGPNDSFVNCPTNPATGMRYKVTQLGWQRR